MQIKPMSCASMLAVALALALAGCAGTPKVPAKEFAPVVDIPADPPSLSTEIGRAHV